MTPAPHASLSLLVLILGSAGVIGAVWSVAFARRAARQLPDRNTMLMVSAGWHAHLDILVTRVEGGSPARFWDTWVSLKEDYDRRLPG